jgi:hypothetical protein
MALEEVLHRDLAEEADALAVLAFGVGQLASAASLRTSGFSSSPTGKIAFASCSWRSRARKYDWSLFGSRPSSRSNVPSAFSRRRA